MADVKNSAPDVEYNDDGKKNPNFVAPAGSEGAAAGTENKGAVKEGEEEAFNDVIDPTKPPEIPVRQSTAQHIIARKNEQIKKLKSRQDEEEAEREDDDEEDEDGADNSTKSSIAKEVKKAVAPLLGKLASDADEAEFQSLIASEPEAKKFSNHIKAYMAHDAWKGVPPSAIYHHLAFTAAQAIGAKKKAAADLEAKQSKGGGRTMAETVKVGDLPSAEDIENMSEADFAKMEKDVSKGKYVKK